MFWCTNYKADFISYSPCLYIFLQIFRSIYFSYIYFLLLHHLPLEKILELIFSVGPACVLNWLHLHVLPFYSSSGILCTLVWTLQAVGSNLGWSCCLLWERSWCFNCKICKISSQYLYILYWHLLLDCTYTEILAYNSTREYVIYAFLPIDQSLHRSI